jgi:dolichol-phosphate mannosyltransferase
VIVPTYNEAANLPILLDRLAAALVDLDYEIVIVDDDSPDLTWQLAEHRAATSTRIQVLRRIGRRGLSSAVLEGMAAARGRELAVIDADLQPDEAILLESVATVLGGDADICLGSRNASGGGYGQFGRRRRLLSWTGTQAARHLLGVTVSDPMSGYFAVSRQRYEAVRAQVNPRGFKILLELLARGPQPRVAEVGYQFRTRAHGETKLTGWVALAYLAAVADLTVGRVAISRFLRFVLVAAVGLSCRVTIGSLAALAAVRGPTEILAFELAAIVELAAHDRYTFPDPAGSWLGRAARFHLVAANALLVHTGTATIIDNRSAAAAGPAPAALLMAIATAGIAVAFVAGYVLSSAIVWPRHRGRP